MIYYVSADQPKAIQNMLIRSSRAAPNFSLNELGEFCRGQEPAYGEFYPDSPRCRIGYRLRIDPELRKTILAAEVVIVPKRTRGWIVPVVTRVKKQ